MPAKTKRSERVGINLTPAQHHQLQAVALEARKSPASYVYELVLQNLDGDHCPAVAEACPSADFGDQIAGLYGLLDALLQQLEQATSTPALERDRTALQASLDGVTEGVAEAQKTLLSLHRSVAGELR